MKTISKWLRRQFLRGTLVISDIQLPFLIFGLPDVCFQIIMLNSNVLKEMKENIFMNTISRTKSKFERNAKIMLG